MTSDRSPEAIEQVAESPEEYCIHVATRWGTVFVRYRTDMQYWTKSVWMPTDKSYNDGRWYESRVYADERGELMEHEHNVENIKNHPNVEWRI